MHSIFDKINKLKLEAQNKVLTLSLKDTLSVDYNNVLNKKYYRKGCTLDIAADAEKRILDIKNKALELVNRYNKSTLGLLDYISSKGYRIVRISGKKKILSKIDETPGFVCAASGLRALYINIVSGSGIGLKSEPMFILEKETPSISEILHDFYLWLAMDMGLPGFDDKTHKLFIRYFVKGEDALLKRIHVNQMIMLKQAVSRDKEAIEFVIDFEKINRSSKKVHKDSIPSKIFI